MMIEARISSWQLVLATHEVKYTTQQIFSQYGFVSTKLQFHKFRNTNKMFNLKIELSIKLSFLFSSFSYQYWLQSILSFGILNQLSIYIKTKILKGDITANKIMRRKLQKETIMKKLSNLHNVKELRDIYNNLFDQNQELIEDVKLLQQKVEQLRQRQATKDAQMASKDKGALSELELHRRELSDNYKLMTDLKKRKQTQMEHTATEQISNEATRFANEMQTVFKELAEEERNKKDLETEGNRLNDTLKAIERELSLNVPKIKEYEQENSSLRKKIQALKKEGYQHDHESIKVVNSLYTNRSKFSRNASQIIKTAREITQPKKSSTKEDILNEEKKLHDEVKTLKTRIESKELEAIKKEGDLKLKVANLKKSDNEAVKNLKVLETTKIRAQGELNKYRKIWKKYLEYQEAIKSRKETVVQETQTEQYVPSGELLRKDFAGILGGKYKFDDRSFLKDNKSSFIKGFHIYQNDIGKGSLTAIRAIYDNQQTNEQNHVFLPGNYLSKCKMVKMQLSEDDFVKLLKVKHNSIEGRITKLQIRSNKNIKYEFGERRPFNDLNQGETVYGYDISIQEYPVCLFGSFVNLRNHWFLESLGVEINEIST